MKEKQLTLNFLRSELLYDVQNYSFVEGDILPDEAQNAKHQVMDIGEEGNVDRVNRIISLAFAECIELLYPFTKEEMEDEEELSDTMERKNTYTMTLTLPEDFAKNTCEILVRYIHEYLTCRIMADWMSIVKPEAYATWKLKTDEAKDNIISTKAARMNRVRRRCSPF